MGMVDKYIYLYKLSTVPYNYVASINVSRITWHYK